MTTPLYNPNSKKEQRRVHVWTPQGWGYTPGTDFWMYPGSAGMITATNAHEMADYGWTTTTLALVSPNAADFLSSSDVGSPAGFSLLDATDKLQSPSIFGDYSHGLQFEQIMGYFPTRLVVDCYTAFLTASANETISCVGLIEDGGSSGTANDALATIFSDGTNFRLRSGAATSGAGAAVDNNYHWWRIIVDATNCTMTMDGGNSVSIATETDEFPAAFGAFSTTTNQLSVGLTHIYYV